MVRITRRALHEVGTADQIVEAFPKSYGECRRTILNFYMSSHEYHVCPKDDHIYKNNRGEDANDQTVCPNCNTARFKINTIKPQRIVTYMSLKAWIKRTYFTKFCREMLSDAAARITADDGRWYSDWHTGSVFRDFVKPMMESKASIAKGMNYENTWFFSFCFDGTDICKHPSMSVIPPLFTLLSSPIWLRSKPSMLWLLGLFPRNAKRLQHFLHVITSQLRDLGPGGPGFEFWDEETKAMVRIWIVLINNNNDGRGIIGGNNGNQVNRNEPNECKERVHESMHAREKSSVGDSVV